MDKRVSQRLVALFIVIVTVAGCSSSSGPDTIASGAGAGSSQCTGCHAPGSAIDPLTTNGTGTFGKHVAHVTNMGLACETCHFNYVTLSTHANGTLDTTNPAVRIVYFNTASNPTGSWNNAAGTCSSLNCHGTDTLNWYGTSADMPAYQSCPSCHSYALGARRRVTGASGDFNANAAIVSNHVTTTGDPAPTQCLVCHDQSTHSGGTVRLWNADTGASIVYSAATPSSLEPFCLSCHDIDGATTAGVPLNPFNDNNTLGAMPNVAGTKIKDYWTGSNNRHLTNGGLTCAGTGAAATGCHGNKGKINMHGSVSKGLLTQNLTLPIAAIATYTYNNYKLCFDCHANYSNVSPQVVLGYKLGGNYDFTAVVPRTPYSTATATIQSMFRDQYDAVSGTGNPPYNDMLSLPQAYAYLPLHNYHLFSTVPDLAFPPVIPNYLSWKYRGDASQTGRITCVTCHNVHGTNGLSARSTFDELGVASAVTGTDQYGTMLSGNYYDPAHPMMSYPMNCALDCHYNAGQTYYWNTPANE